MATIATRINSSGILYVNGIFDEITLLASKTTTDTVYASLIDEVTYNPNSGIASTNLVSYSYYNASNWSNVFTSTATITTGIDSPDGKNNAVRFAGNNTGNALLRVTFPSFTPNGTDSYTTSFYARHVSGSKIGCGSDLNDGVGTNYSASLITGSWVRISYTGVLTPTSKTFVDLFSDSNTNNIIDFWGVQIERASSVGIYVETVNGTIVPGFSQRIGNNGVLYVSGNFDEITGIF